MMLRIFPPSSNHGPNPVCGLQEVGQRQVRVSEERCDESCTQRNNESCGEGCTKDKDSKASPKPAAAPKARTAELKDNKLEL